MRVIAGTFRSRLLSAPQGWNTRPTSDRLRETLFNVLAPRIENAIFADLFAGTGAVGIEALSRGARQVYFAESAAPAMAALRRNLASLRITEGVHLEAAGVAALLRRLRQRSVRLDIAFVDPPYSDTPAYQSTLSALAAQPLLFPGAIVVAEHARRDRLPEVPGLIEYRRINQGDAALTFLRAPSAM